MSTAPIRARELPSWLMWVGSAAIVLHLTALGALALSARSGPWVTPFGNTPAEGPTFAQTINSYTTDYYLRYLGMTHNYHFVTSQAAFPGVAFEVRLRDRDGNVFKTVKFPEENANFVVRHRQGMLAQAIGDDQPAPQRGGERLNLQGKDSPKINFWLEPREVDAIKKTNVVLPRTLPTVDAPVEGRKQNTIVLVPVGVDDRNNVPDRPSLSTPSDWSMLLTRAYARHMARKYNADTVEIIRIHRSAIPPELMFAEQPPNDMFNPFIDWVSYFGVRDGRTGDFVE